MLTINYQSQFKKDYKLAIKRGLNVTELEKVINILASEQPLPAHYKDHALKDSAKYQNMRECHIKPDWLLVYQIKNTELILNLVRTRTHSDLF